MPSFSEVLDGFVTLLQIAFGIFILFCIPMWIEDFYSYGGMSAREWEREYNSAADCVLFDAENVDEAYDCFDERY